MEIPFLASARLELLPATNLTVLMTPSVPVQLLKLLCLGLAASFVAHAQTLEPGFTSLFNGKDLTGWSGKPEHWSVKDGAIVGKSTKETPAQGNTFLIARNGQRNRTVEDFELRFSYRIIANNPQGFANSGVQYRSLDKGNFVVAGYQADFEAGQTYSGILYDEGGGAGGRGIMANRGQRVQFAIDGKRTEGAPLAKSEDIQAKIRANDWNEYVIIAEGNHLRHFINGVQTVDVIDNARGKRLSAGILALQLHAGEPMTVEFKNLRIKTLVTGNIPAGAAVRVPKDFKLETLYNVPKETQGSWVAMCLDPKGRLIVSDQNGALHRVVLPPLSGGAVQTETINLPIGEAHGLLWAFDSLYVAVNEGKRTHGIYRVRDTNNDDTLDKVELLRELKAGGEHGVHSLVPSPDGKSIYVVVGNSSELTQFDASRVPQIWGEDNLLPRMPTGFMDNSYAPQGWIARMDPDGKRWELIAMGLRNEFDIAFNDAGELLTYDADMEWDIGAPWYRPTRVNHVISGAEYGFRNGNGKWPEYFIDSFGAAVNIGPGSPTGIAFGYGAKFPAKYQRALFLADWSFGKLRAVHLRPDGSSYTGESEEFISGQPFPVTDFVINPADGAMYLAVGGRGAQSALYRITYAGSESTVPVKADKKLQDQRDVRLKLEKFHGTVDPKAVDAAWSKLGDKDRAIRFAARTALEWQPVATWKDRALKETNPRKSIAALVALARVSGRDTIHRTKDSPVADATLTQSVFESLNRINWSKLSRADQLDLIRAYQLAFIRLGKPDGATLESIANKFSAIFPTRDIDRDIQLSQILAYLDAPSTASKLVTALKSAASQEEQIEYAQALRVVKSGWTRPLREDYIRWFQKAESYRGGNTFAGSIRSIRKAAIDALPAQEAEALKPLLEAKLEKKSPRDALSARSFVKEWKVEELVPIVEQGLRGGRNFERGRSIYGEVACAACHRFNQEGGSVGPELTGVVGRFSVRDMLDAIVEPSKVISDQYNAIVVTKKDGDVLTGRVANLGGNSLNLVEDMFDPGRMTDIKRSDIESIQPSTVSMMPEGLVNSLKGEEIADLIAYLFSRGDPNHKSFKK